MLSDQNLIDLMVSEPSWEDVIVKIIAEENMDPWAIDICRLAGTFINYLKKMEQLDLRVPARFILITAILLRMKSDVLVERKEKILIPEGDVKTDSEMLRALAAIPPLQPPIKRMPLGNVSLTELITALRKAFEVQERREIRKAKVRAIVARAVPPEQEDISNRISNLMTAIQTAITELESNVAFTALIKKWERSDIVAALIPLLHLSQDGKVSINQEDLFKEIFVKMKSGVKDVKQK